MDSDQEVKVNDYIEREKSKNASFLDAILQIEEETSDGLGIFSWLKNDESLYDYAELILKKEELTFFEHVREKLLSLKLMITCPFFKDFKSFLKTLKDGGENDEEENLSQEEVERMKYSFKGTSISTIFSETYRESTSQGLYWVSRIACKNAQNFGLILPAGDAFDAGTNPGLLSLETIPPEKKYEKPENEWNTIDYSSFLSKSKGNFADLYFKSDSSYGHRAVAFKGDNGEWYVLDPFTRVDGKLGNAPKKMKDYLKERSLIKANFYESDGYEKRGQSGDFLISQGSFQEQQETVQGQQHSLSSQSSVHTESEQGHQHQAAAQGSVPVGSIQGQHQSPNKPQNPNKPQRPTHTESYHLQGFGNYNIESFTNPKVENALQWAINIANDNYYGYEWGGKGGSGYDCSGLVTAAFKHAGFGVPLSGTATMRENFTKAGFEWISPFDKSKLKRGDILLKDHGKDGERHTEMYLGNGKLVGARGNKDHKRGDSSGKEIAVTGSYDGTANYFLNSYKWEGVLRYKGKKA